jgi:zinc/manganese transport system substrate-binding protein
VADAGLDADAVDACVESYTAELAAVDAEIADLVAEMPEDARLLLTSHDSLSYFADRYGFEVIGTVIPAPSGLAETNPAQLEELAELIDETGVRAIFAETQHSTDDAEALAERVGDVEVVTLYTGTLGEPGSGADTYVGFLRTNAGLVADALG